MLADAPRWAPAAEAVFPRRHAVLDAQSAEVEVGAGALPNEPLPICDLLDRGLLPDNTMFCSSNKASWDRVVAWARSYNLGYKWSTGGGKKRSAAKTHPANTRLKQQHTCNGIAVMILPAVDSTEQSLYVVTDKFSHSVCFSRLRVTSVRSDTGAVQQCVKWVHDRSSFADSIESTLLFAKYHTLCCERKITVTVRACFLSASKCYQLFVNPGWLLLDDVVASSVVLFDMTQKLMPGTTKNKTTRNKSQKPAAASSAADPAPLEMIRDACEDQDGPDADDTAYMDRVVDGMNDTSGSEDEIDDDDAKTEDVKDNEAAADHVSHELNDELKNASGQTLPSVRQVSAAAEAAARNSCAQTAPELQEEALMLLIKQRQQAKSGSLRFEGVGDTDASAIAEPFRCEESDSDTSDVDFQSMQQDMQATQFLDTLQSDVAVDASALQSWAMSFLATLQSLQSVRALQHGKELGEDRSISLVLMKPGRVAGCTCVRCRWGKSAASEAIAGDMPELLWVTWLNNTAHGLAGRKARHVNLDVDDKVLYCTADSTFARTGILGGVGHPEIQCDEQHAEVLIGYMGAAMRKVKKTSPERDQVPGACIRVRQFYELSLYRMTSMDGEDSSVCLLACLLACGCCVQSVLLLSIGLSLCMYCVAAVILCCDQDMHDESSRCRACKSRELPQQHGGRAERAVQCPVCMKYWHASCVHTLSSHLAGNVLASFREEHGSLVNGLRSCVTGSLGSLSVWAALTRARAGNRPHVGGTSGASSSSSSSAPSAEPTQLILCRFC